MPADPQPRLAQLAPWLHAAGRGRRLPPHTLSAGARGCEAGLAGHTADDTALATAVLWLGPAALLWGVLAVVARIATVEAATVSNVLFVLALPLTYVAIVGAAVHASSRPRQAVMRVAALTLGLVVGLTLLELAAAARLVHWELFFKSMKGEQQYYVPDPDLGFRHTPNVPGSGRPRSDVEVACGLPASRSDQVTVTYDQRGYRNATALSRVDIVLIGDSFVEGDYVSDDQIVSRLLQARLRQPVANLGVAGYGTAQDSSC